jgi:hypothetical protein
MSETKPNLARRLPVPFHKVILVGMVYALTVPAFPELSFEGNLYGFVIGTGLSMIILVVRTRKDLLEASIVVAGSLVGAGWGYIFAEFFAWPSDTWFREPTLGDFTWVFVAVVGAALVGGLASAWTSKCRTGDR